MLERPKNGDTIGISSVFVCVYYCVYKGKMAKKAVLDGLNKKIKLLVLVCFFLSGLTGLVYEILWQRLMRRRVDFLRQSRPLKRR